MSLSDVYNVKCTIKALLFTKPSNKAALVVYIVCRVSRYDFILMLSLNHFLFSYCHVTLTVEFWLVKSLLMNMLPINFVLIFNQKKYLL